VLNRHICLFQNYIPHVALNIYFAPVTVIFKKNNVLMKVWIAKAVVQKTISVLPFKHRVNYLFQRYMTKGVLLTDALMDDKLTHCSNHLKYFFKHGNKPEGFTTLEIGTGWYPIVPIGLFLSGAAEIYTIDISSLLKTTAIHQTINRFLHYYSTGKLQTYLPNIKPERLQVLKTALTLQGQPQSILETMHIKTTVGDARKMIFADGRIDLINSNNTFEHIPEFILAGILKEFKRVLKPDGVMSHQIDMSDHFAHLDKSITIYNFLQYTDAQWNLIDNAIQPQNRLRITDFRRLHQQAGFKILEEINRPGSLADLNSITLAAQYRANTAEENAVSHTLLVAVK
jgi:SAM-dependent methyltransferase